MAGLMAKQKKAKHKIPFISQEISTPKRPHYLGLPNIEDRHIAWRFSKADLGGPYTCNGFSYGDFQQLWNRLRAFEKMNVSEMQRAGSFHFMPLAKMTREDRQRLSGIELDDIDGLYSFHIDGPCRMWCTKVENILVLVWWDRNHGVCPVVKSHT
jgi:hypothetical protein